MSQYHFTQKAITCDIECYKEGRTNIEETLYLIQKDIRTYCNINTFRKDIERIAMLKRLYENALSRLAKSIKETGEKELKKLQKEAEKKNGGKNNV